MRIAAAIAITFSGLYVAAAPTSAAATAVIRGNTCFSGVSSDEADARAECARAGFTCAAPKVIRCRFDNTRHMYVCQCKDPPKNEAGYTDPARGKPEKRTMQPGETQPQMPPQEDGAPPAEQEPSPEQLGALAHGC